MKLDSSSPSSSSDLEVIEEKPVNKNKNQNTDNNSKNGKIFKSDNESSDSKESLDTH